MLEKICLKLLNDTFIILPLTSINENLMEIKLKLHTAKIFPKIYLRFIISQIAIIVPFITNIN
jgi:hypothetical protein